MVGLESLARGMGGPVNRFSPEQMFGWAEEANLSEAFDDLCRVSALKAFAALAQYGIPSLALFLNLDATPALPRKIFRRDDQGSPWTRPGSCPATWCSNSSDLDFERAPGAAFPHRGLPVPRFLRGP